MKIEKEDIRLLASATREAGEDLFCVTGIVPGFDELATLFTVQEEPTLLLLPGTFVLPETLIKEDVSVRFLRAGLPPWRAVLLRGDILAADVRLFCDESFRAFCEKCGMRHILIPFAELADGNEYGGRTAYGWIGEWRAALPYELRVTALFSAPPEDHAVFVRLFGSPGCTVIDASIAPEVYAYETADVRKKYAFTISLSQKHPMKRTAVLFTDRREAEEFLRLLQKQGIASIYVNGTLTAKRYAEAMESFANCGGLLVATKSVLASCLFYRADEVIFCGMPYSRAFMTRCASFAADGALECCFCTKDIETDINILKCFAENRAEEERETFLSDTMQKLLAVKQMLAEPE